MARIYTKQALLDPSMLAQDAAYRKSLADSAAQNRMQAAQAIRQGMTAFGKGAGETIGQGIGMATRYGDYQDFLKEFGDDPEAKAAAWKFMYEGDTNPMQQYIATKRAKEETAAKEEANRIAKEQQEAELQKQKEFKIAGAKNAIRTAEGIMNDPEASQSAKAQAQEKKANAIAELKMYGVTYAEDQPAVKTPAQPEVVSGDEMFDEELPRSLYEAKLAGFHSDLGQRVLPFGKQYITKKEKENWLERAQLIKDPTKREEILNTIRRIPTEEEAKTYWAAEDAEQARLEALESRKAQRERGKQRREAQNEKITEAQRTMNAAKADLDNLQEQWNKLDAMEQSLAKNKNNMNNTLWQQLQKAQEKYENAKTAYKTAGGK